MEEVNLSSSPSQGKKKAADDKKIYSVRAVSQREKLKKKVLKVVLEKGGKQRTDLEKILEDH